MKDHKWGGWRKRKLICGWDDQHSEWHRWAFIKTFMYTPCTGRQTQRTLKLTTEKWEPHPKRLLLGPAFSNSFCRQQKEAWARPQPTARPWRPRGWRGARADGSGRTRAIQREPGPRQPRSGLRPHSSRGSPLPPSPCKAAPGPHRPIPTARARWSFAAATASAAPCPRSAASARRPAAATRRPRSAPTAPSRARRHPAWRRPRHRRTDGGGASASAPLPPHWRTPRRRSRPVAARPMRGAGSGPAAPSLPGRRAATRTRAAGRARPRRWLWSGPCSWRREPKQTGREGRSSRRPGPSRWQRADKAGMRLRLVRFPARRGRGATLQRRSAPPLRRAEEAERAASRRPGRTPAAPRGRTAAARAQRPGCSGASRCSCAPGGGQIPWAPGGRAPGSALKGSAAFRREDAAPRRPLRSRTAAGPRAVPAAGCRRGDGAPTHAAWERGTGQNKSVALELSFVCLLIWLINRTALRD